jgi:hypothetical protein
MDYGLMSSSSDLILRFAQPADSNVLFDLIKGLAEYEQLSQAVTGVWIPKVC